MCIVRFYKNMEKYSIKINSATKYLISLETLSVR